MPITPTYPGVYIEELPSGVRTITGVPTSVTAFVGLAPRGPDDEPIVITSFADYERLFGGLSTESQMSYSVFQYYQNGGSMAVIVRLSGDKSAPAVIDLENGVKLNAKYIGDYANEKLRARVDQADIKDADKADSYNLTVRDTSTGQQERYTGISIKKDPKRSLDKMIDSSQLVTVKDRDGNIIAGYKLDTLPKVHDEATPGEDPLADPKPAPAPAPGGGGGGGGGGGPAPAAKKFFSASDKTGSAGEIFEADGKVKESIFGTEAGKSGLYSLLKTDIFNLLVLPQLTPDADVPGGILTQALKLCVDKRAMLVVDAPLAWNNLDKAVAGAIDGKPLSGDDAKNSALYFPRIKAFDKDGNIKEFAPSGAVAGVFARTDVQRGVWKAPAGTDASLSGAVGLSIALTDLENGRLNQLGVNSLRTFPVFGRVVWGARTGRGADQLGDQWKYVPVRRLALFIEESLFRGTKWVVFEPNDEPLWSQIRLNVGAFMQNLFRQGAFQGKAPKDAYFVKCDKETTTQNDINLGIVNIIVGFAPLKPAEFVIIKIQQMAGQVEV